MNDMSSNPLIEMIMKLAAQRGSMGQPQGSATPAMPAKPWETPMGGPQPPRFQPPATTAAPSDYTIVPGQGTSGGIIDEQMRMRERLAPLGTERGVVGSQSPGVSSQDATAIEQLLAKLRGMFGGR